MNTIEFFLKNRALFKNVTAFNNPLIFSTRKKNITQKITV